MSLRSAIGPIVLPNMDIMRESGNSAPVNGLLDASGEMVGAVFQFQYSGILKKVAVRTGTVTTANPINVRIETVDDTTGRPSGTLYQSGATGQIASPASNTTYWVDINSTNGITVTKGDYAAIVVTLEYTNGNLNIQHAFSAFTNDRGVPYAFTFLNSTWTFSSDHMPNFGFQYSDGMKPFIGMYPGVSAIGQTFNSGSSPNRYALRFRIPYRARLIGFATHMMIHDANFILYAPDGVTALTSTWSDNNIQAISGITRNFYYFFQKDIILTPNVYYRIACVPTTTSNVSLRAKTFTNDGSLLGIDCIVGGSWFHQSTCTGAPSSESSWTNTFTTRPDIALIVDHLDDGQRFNRVY